MHGSTAGYARDLIYSKLHVLTLHLLLVLLVQVDGASIFSVADGKRLASTPAPHVTGWEAARARKIALAAQESPQLAGAFNLLPPRRIGGRL